MKAIAGYVASRLALMAGLLLVVSFVVFSLTYLAPGDPLDAIAGNFPRTPEVTAALTAQYGLDRPFHEQYLSWLGRAVRMDLGESIMTRQPVLVEIADRMEITLFLSAYAFVLAVAVGIPLAVLAATRPRTVWDRLAVTVSVFGVSAPAFVTGLVLLYLFGVRWPVFPVYAAGEGFAERVTHTTLPAIALAFMALGLIVKFTRSALLTVLDQDYITFARARGVPPRRVLLRYGLRNALVPVITALGLVLIGMLSGSVLIEQTFSLPGVGGRMVEAVTSTDIPMIQGMALLIAATVVVISLLVDLAYFAVSPDLRRRFRS
ncbi:ABC transporter permease [Microbispora sp. H11081]|uniref:ABC transporter permease n=1 Tax=Microbispora sp. H11081 TaxID=2729107 RepID=UPI001B8AC398|nr:ABC transporter permease [Microbispora sp. H11081]